MSFLNPKEDIINIELTEKGKEFYLFGKFNPKFYSFSDKNIVYDNSVETYVGDIAGINNRISLTPRITTKNDDCILGNSEVSNRNKPSLFLKVLNGQIISGSVQRQYEDDLSSNIYTFEVEAEDFFNYDTLSMDSDASILIDVTEFNSLFEKENFDITISKLDNNEEEDDLTFISRTLFRDITTSAFHNDNGNMIGIIEDLPVVTPKNVEYYFHVLVDDQILQDYYFTNGIEEEDREDIDREIVNC
jgi:hypothetical protein